jgi:predicted nuclease with TOPRIM domain
MMGTLAQTSASGVTSGDQFLGGDADKEARMASEQAGGSKALTYGAIAAAVIAAGLAYYYSDSWRTASEMAQNLSSQVAMLTAERDQLKSASDADKKALEAATAEATTLKASVADLEAKLTAAQAEANKLKAELETALSSGGTTSQELEAAKQMLEAAQAETASAKAELEKARAEAYELKQKVTELQAQLEAQTGSSN